MLNKIQMSVKVRKGITNTSKCLHNLLLKGGINMQKRASGTNCI